MTPASIIQKLRTPPAVHNWVKSIRARRDETAFALYNFATNPPRSSLAEAVRICGNIVVDGINLEQALKCTQAIKNAAARQRAYWIAKAFHPYAQSAGWKGIQVFREMVEYYPVSANVRVHVRPAFVVNDGKKLVPYFLICWAKMDLTSYQLRILSTLIHQTILTLEEFEGSDAVIVATPVSRHSKCERIVQEWKASDFAILDEEERQTLFDRYAGALSDAEAMIIESLG